MVADVRVEGLDQLERLAKELKRTGQKDLRRELMRGIQRATKPAKAAVARSARQRLPSRGGLNDLVAGAKISTKVRTSGRAVGVRVTGSKSGVDVASIDRGRLRHPVFGNRHRWVNQKTVPGWFSDPMEEMMPSTRRAIVGVLDTVSGELVRRTRS